MRNMYPQNGNADVREVIGSFIYDQSLRKLVEAFGGKYPGPTFREDLKYLVAFSERWDYRKNINTKTENNEKARWLIEQDTLTRHQLDCLSKAKEKLGLIDNSTPQERYYDYIWVLGGARLSCLLRTRLANLICKNLKKSPKKISLLGSSRFINESERAATDTYAPNAKTEFDLFLFAHDKEFGNSNYSMQEEQNENVNLSWRILEYDDGVSVLSAPSLEPSTRRANSLDTYMFFVKTYNIQPKESILLVTSEIYVPYQHLEAFRSIALSKNVSIETVGFPAAWGGELQGMSSNENYLQEIRSAIQSLSRLLGC